MDGYGDWRFMLADFKGNVAFQELIDFVEKEGVIGTVVAAKLYNDFRTHLDEAESHSKKLGEDGDWWLEIYKDWMNAFEYASDNGAVEFVYSR